MENPFHGVIEVKRRSLAALAKAAEEINALLADGKRLFNVPIGLADAVVEALAEAGPDGEPRWIVKIPSFTDTDVTILVRDPTSRFKKDQE